MIIMYTLIVINLINIYQGAIVTSLVNRFKEFRRTCIVRGKPSNPKKIPKQKSPGITQTPSKPVKTTGEDLVS